MAKAAACDRPTDTRRHPVSRFSVTDVCQRVNDLGIRVSYSTLWRWLSRDAIRPWLQEQWLFPQDPRLAEKAAPILDLYQRRWEGQALGPRDVVLCADEMTGVQAISRIHAGTAPAPRRRARYEFEYKRHGTRCYLAILDVCTGKVYGEVGAGTGIEPFETCLAHCLAQPCYQEAERIFLVMDNGCSHHPNTSPERLKAKFPNVRAVHLPVHSSWLNQIEIYFSIVHRKALTPADFSSVEALEQRLLWFQWYYNQDARPFRWNYTLGQLEAHIERLAKHEDWLLEARLALGARSANQPHPVMN